MFRWLLSTLFTLLIIMFVGRFLLATFPEAQVIWGEVKAQAVYLYNLSVAHIGIVGTIILIIAAAGAFGVSRR
ncbi:hypothetical protein H9655_21610 [Cytobacillus sp. Sa5YUA1]|uniref:Uncharacterized protein n=1 Tax=Cytobacillus stercorigallinarum TaxID=2762240 RepID=A0ABR8QW14_9BACI|nr:hypothetical protein [Cytobacillus stercorigallinarum]MBD7939644.1 hypothetical protein [Cytobacillus stercorigallinarum]